jgi:hypothetical protein
MVTLSFNPNCTFLDVIYASSPIKLCTGSY